MQTVCVYLRSLQEQEVSCQLYYSTNFLIYSLNAWGMCQRINSSHFLFKFIDQELEKIPSCAIWAGKLIEDEM